MKVICIRDCMGSLDSKLFTKDKIYEFDNTGRITDNNGHSPPFHLGAPGKTPLEKWNNHYSSGKDRTSKFHDLFKQLSYRKF